MAAHTQEMGGWIRLLVVGAMVFTTWQWLRNWGATAAERQMALPGDELIGDPAAMTTLAVPIEAPAADIWPWLLQIGQDRAGFYSYDALENLVGLHIHSADQIVDEWQTLTVGDSVRLTPQGWMGQPDGLVLPVARIEAPRSLVLRESPPSWPWNAVWSFHVVPTSARSCRLISRSRSERPPIPLRLAGIVGTPVTAAMTRRMLLGIKARAERADRLARSAAAGPTAPNPGSKDDPRPRVPQGG